MEFTVQSNLCTATSLGTAKKWPWFEGGRYWEGLIKNII
jgi:hypothetical protein